MAENTRSVAMKVMVALLMVLIAAHKCEGGWYEVGYTRYTITVKTSGVHYAGTDAAIHVTLKGVRGSTGRIALIGVSKAFHRYAVSTFRVRAKYVGRITQIMVESDNSGWGAGWYPDYITVTTTSHCQMTFHLNRWFTTSHPSAVTYPEYRSFSCTKSLGKPKTYVVTVKTSNAWYAGTAARVYIALTGRSKSTGYIRLRKSVTHSHPFRINQVDKFYITAPNVGNDIRSIRLTHDRTGGSPGWKVSYVTVRPKGKANSCGQKFIYNHWIQKRTLDVSRYRSNGYYC